MYWNPLDVEAERVAGMMTMFFFQGEDGIGDDVVTGVQTCALPIFRDARTRRDESGQRLKAALEGLQEIGCVVKDLDIGLVDFPTVFRGEEVYLCWKLGRTAIQCLHRLDEGFARPKPLLQGFLYYHP